jgi:23S rRNA pseudouridine1911/1915/1917 synthase
MAMGSATEMGFTVLYDEGPCLAVCKPAGLPTQAPAGIDSLEARVKAWLKHKEQLPGKVYLGIPHRLDRPASGAIVFAKLSRAARRLAKQFERRQVRKLYWAGVEGVVEPPDGSWEDYVRKIPDVPRAEIVPPTHPDARHALLHYRTLACHDNVTWLEVVLETGRMHQVRIQAASRGHPLLGDAQYGARTSFGPRHEDWRQRAIALHARRLEFWHPMTKEPIVVVAPPASYWPVLEGLLDRGDSS